jgi:hypothetical protein
MKRLCIIGFVLAILFSCGWVIHHNQTPEYRYKGIPFTKWVNQNVAWSSTMGLTEQGKADLNKLGTNALPPLLSMLIARDTVLKSQFISLIEEQNVLPARFRPVARLYSAEDKHLLAVIAFGALGTNALPAVPALIRLTKDDDGEIRSVALNCLLNTKPGREILLPELTRLIHDPEKAVQFLAVEVLRKQYPQDAEAAGLYQLFPEFRPSPPIQPVPN